MECKAVEKKFVDTISKQAYHLHEDLHIVSDSSQGTDTKSLLIIPPAVVGESYAVQLTSGSPPSLSLIHGNCSVNGKSLLQTPILLSPGSFITLGSARSLQYVSSGSNYCPQVISRVLPPTPGKALEPSPPSKPQRLKRQCEPSPPAHISNESDNSLDVGIRPQLQRIAAEISARIAGYESRKPPPPYEQVGNSIAYQLLHQQQHKMVTSELIDALYPALKENELKDASLLQTYSSYLQIFKDSLEKPASLQCMLPADLPTCDFVVDMLLHLCCMPHMTTLAEKQGEVWCQLLALFSQSQQNQCHMASKRHPARVLSCMHLNIMSPKLKFQQYGWIVLTNTVNTPTPTGGKPVLSEPSLTLAMSLTECQLATSHLDTSLVVAIVCFLAKVATTAKCSVSHNSIQNQAYTEEQAVRILALFQEKFVLRQVMKVPPHLRSETSFEQAYSDLVKALVPIRGVFQASDHCQRKTKSSIDSQAANCMAPGSSAVESTGPQHSMTALSNIEASKEEEVDMISNSSLPHEPDKLPCSNHVSSTNTKHGQDLAVKVMENLTLIPHNNSHDSSQNCATSFETPSYSQERELQVTLSISDSPAIAEHSLPEEPPSPTIPFQAVVSPPLTPNTINLAADVQDLLDTLNTPLEPVSSTVKVPTLSRYNRYYRHSVKKASFKQGGLPSIERDEEKQTPTDRLLWDEMTPCPTLVGRDESDLFEVSGRFLSSQHSTVEEVMSDHQDIYLALQTRVELVEAVMSMWVKGKGLQAVTNLLQGCFSENIDNDVVLFVDTLQCFISHQSPWTLAVCMVLLPPLHQLIASSQTPAKILVIVSNTVLVMVQRFSELVLSCTTSPTKRKIRLSSSLDREQQLVCYRELHCIRHVLHQRLDSDQDSTSNVMRKLHAALRPFIQQQNS